MTAGIPNGIRILHWITDLAFPSLERLDEWWHGKPLHPTPLCRLVGHLEIGFYERTIDWDNPIYVRPECVCGETSTRNCPVHMNGGE